VVDREKSRNVIVYTNAAGRWIRRRALQYVTPESSCRLEMVAFVAVPTTIGRSYDTSARADKRLSDRMAAAHKWNTSGWHQTHTVGLGALFPDSDDEDAQEAESKMPEQVDMHKFPNMVGPSTQRCLI